MSLKPAEPSFTSRVTVDAGFEDTVQKVRHEWGNFWTYMIVFASLVILVFIFSR